MGCAEHSSSGLKPHRNVCYGSLASRDHGETSGSRRSSSRRRRRRTQPVQRASSSAKWQATGWPCAAVDERRLLVGADAPAPSSSGCGTGSPTAGRPATGRRPAARSAARCRSSLRVRAPAPPTASAWVYGCVGRVVDVVASADLDDLAEVHHGDPVGDVADHRQVVGDEQVRQPELVLQLLEQVDDAGLDADVERRHRLVEHDEARARGPAPGRCRCAGADRRRTRAGSGCRARGCRPTCSSSSATRSGRRRCPTARGPSAARR